MKVIIPLRSIVYFIMDLLHRRLIQHRHIYYVGGNENLEQVRNFTLILAHNSLASVVKRQLSIYHPEMEVFSSK